MTSSCQRRLWKVVRRVLDRTAGQLDDVAGDRAESPGPYGPVVQERKQFGKDIIEFQTVQAMLADMVIQVEAARLLIYRAAFTAGTGPPMLSKRRLPNASPTRWPSRFRIGPCNCTAAMAIQPNTKSNDCTAIPTAGRWRAAPRQCNASASPPSISGAVSINGRSAVYSLSALYDDEHRAFQASVATLLDRAMARGAGIAAIAELAGRNGFLGMQVPAEYAGGGVDDPVFTAVLVDELIRSAPTGFALALTEQIGVAVPLLVDHAHAGQKARWLPRLASGECLAAISSVPVPCTAAGDGVRILGVASDVINGQNADLLIATARSDAGEDSVVLIDRSDRAPRDVVDQALLAPVAAGREDIDLNGLEIGAVDVLDGAAAAQLWRDQQLWLAVLAVAGTRAALETTLDYVRARTAFGRPIATFENTRHVLATVSAELMLTESFVAVCVGQLAAKQLGAVQAAAANLSASQLFWRATDQGMQLHGGYG